ncbi:nascent polypeptide-associated complex subunit alpha, muscle-specific form-like [Homarus americanus]|uniref:nascent polypeptide-associated complex subunit alpha, muscle-specific form-like n=1 Tax=Homarus americanus TaxID=6706 RepID=UPI001C47B5ED|nr:nascent polypeptide-associated complex subunit alpha, muscle-specific form-like [Homarus americanus]
MKVSPRCLCQVLVAAACVVATVGLSRDQLTSGSDAPARRMRKTEYDKCSHPFHSWLCSPSPAARKRFPVSPPSTTTRRPPPPTTTPPPRQGSLLDAEPSRVGKPQSVPFPGSPSSPPPTVPPPPPPTTQPPPPPTTPPPPPPTTPPPPPPTTPVPRRGSILFSEATQARKGGISDSVPAPGPPVPPPTVPPPSSTPYDRCSHPLHAWRCRTSSTTPAPPPTRSAFGDFPDASFTARVQQLPEALPTPTTPAPPPPKTYDKCSHPFHSWLCQPAPKPRTTHRPPRPPTTPRPPPPPTTEAPAGSGVFPDATNFRRGSILFSEALFPSPPPPTTTTPPPPPTTTPYDKCNHPLHAWRCQKSTRPPSTEDPSPAGGLLDPEPANIPAGVVLPAPMTNTPPPARPRSFPTTPKPSWDGADPCSHAFHSWLCKTPSPRITLPPSTRPPPPPTTTPPRQGTLLSPDASFLPPASIFFPDNSLTTTTTTTTPPPPPTTEPPPPPTTEPLPPPTTEPPPPSTLAPASGSFLAAEPLFLRQEPLATPELDPQPEPEPTLTDFCNHPFHSFLCDKPKRRLSKPSLRLTTAAKPPLDEPEPGASFLAPKTRTDPKGRGSFPDTLANPTTPATDYKCNHPFHSWRCRPASEGSKTQGTVTTSNTFLVGVKEIPNIQNLPLEGDNDAEVTRFQSLRKLGNSFGGLRDENSNSAVSTITESPGFIPTVPTIPGVPTIPTVPTTPQPIPTVPTVPGFIPTVPTVPPTSASRNSFGQGSKARSSRQKGRKVLRRAPASLYSSSLDGHSREPGFSGEFVASPSVLHPSVAAQSLVRVPPPPSSSHFLPDSSSDTSPPLSPNWTVSSSLPSFFISPAPKPHSLFFYSPHDSSTHSPSTPPSPHPRSSSNPSSPPRPPPSPPPPVFPPPLPSHPRSSFYPSQFSLPDPPSEAAFPPPPSPRQPDPTSHRARTVSTSPQKVGPPPPRPPHLPTEGDETPTQDEALIAQGSSPSVVRLALPSHQTFLGVHTFEPQRTIPRKLYVI